MLEEYTMTMRGLLDDHQDLCLIPYDAGHIKPDDSEDERGVGVSTIRILLCAKDWQSPRESVILATLLVNSYELKFARPNQLYDKIRNPHVKSSCGELLSVMRGYANCLMLMGYSVWLPRANDIKIYQMYYDQEKEFEPKGMHFSEFKPCREVETNEFVICDTSDLSVLFTENLKNYENPIEKLACLQSLARPQTENEWEYWRKVIGKEAVMDEKSEPNSTFAIKTTPVTTTQFAGPMSIAFKVTASNSAPKDTDQKNEEKKSWWKFW